MDLISKSSFTKTFPLRLLAAMVTKMFCGRLNINLHAPVVLFYTIISYNERWKTLTTLYTLKCQSQSITKNASGMSMECEDLKIIAIFIALRRGFRKYCFLFVGQSSNKRPLHSKDWPARNMYKPRCTDVKCILHEKAEKYEILILELHLSNQQL